MKPIVALGKKTDPKGWYDLTVYPKRWEIAFEGLYQTFDRRLTSFIWQQFEADLKGRFRIRIATTRTVMVWES